MTAVRLNHLAPRLLAEIAASHCEIAASHCARCKRTCGVPLVRAVPRPLAEIAASLARWQLCGSITSHLAFSQKLRRRIAKLRRRIARVAKELVVCLLFDPCAATREPNRRVPILHLRVRIFSLSGARPEVKAGPSPARSDPRQPQPSLTLRYRRRRRVGLRRGTGNRRTRSCSPRCKFPKVKIGSPQDPWRSELSYRRADQIARKPFEWRITWNYIALVLSEHWGLCALRHRVAIIGKLISNFNHRVLLY